MIDRTTRSKRRRVRKLIGVADLEVKRHRDVLREILADTRQVVQRRDAGGLELGARTDARQQQQLRRVVAAAADDHLAARLDDRRFAGLFVFDAGDPPALEHEAPGERAGFDGEIGARQNRLQIDLGRTGPPAVFDGDVDDAKALGFGGKILTHRQPGVHGGLLDQVEAEVLDVVAADPERSVGAMMRRVAVIAPLGAPEVRQHVGIAPAGAPLLAPEVVVERMAAHIEHAVDRRGYRPAPCRAAGRCGGCRSAARARWNSPSCPWGHATPGASRAACA